MQEWENRLKIDLFAFLDILKKYEDDIVLLEDTLTLYNDWKKYSLSMEGNTLKPDFNMFEQWKTTNSYREGLFVTSKIFGKESEKMDQCWFIDSELVECSNCAKQYEDL